MVFRKPPIGCAVRTLITITYLLYIYNFILLHHMCTSERHCNSSTVNQFAAHTQNHSTFLLVKYDYHYKSAFMLDSFLQIKCKNDNICTNCIFFILSMQFGSSSQHLHCVPIPIQSNRYIYIFFNFIYIHFYL